MKFALVLLFASLVASQQFIYENIIKNFGDPPVFENST